MPSITRYSNELTGKLASLIEKGRQEASAHRPASDATRMDQHEAAIQSEAESWLAREHQLFSAVLTDGARAGSDLQHKALELEGRIEQVLADDSMASAVAADMADDRQELTRVIENRMRAQVDWRHFRARHGIIDEAEYPDSRIWHFAIVAVLALVETSVNAFFFENAQGLLGGFVVALAVSVVNLGGALVLGMLFRYKNLRDRQARLGGWLSLVAFIILSIYCNALFSSFRAEYQLLLDPTDTSALREAFTRATEEAGKVFWLGTSLGDLMSFILFAIGILLSGFAFYKGYSVDDRFPGHGKKDRVVRAAQAIEHEKQEMVRQRVKGILHARRHELQALIHEPAQLVSAAGSRIAEIESARSTYDAVQDAIQRDFALVLGSYRDANAAIRATDPPQYFSEVPNLRISINKEVLDSVVSALRGVQESARLLRDKHQEALNEKLNALQRDAATILNETFTEFIQAVERDAEDLINRQIINVPALA